MRRRLPSPPIFARPPSANRKRLSPSPRVASSAQVVNAPRCRWEKYAVPAPPACRPCRCAQPRSPGRRPYGRTRVVPPPRCTARDQRRRHAPTLLHCLPPACSAGRRSSIAAMANDPSRHFRILISMPCRLVMTFLLWPPAVRRRVRCRILVGFPSRAGRPWPRRVVRPPANPEYALKASNAIGRRNRTCGDHAAPANGPHSQRLSHRGTMELIIRDLSKRYANGVQAIDRVSLSIAPGMFGLLGPQRRRQIHADAHAGDAAGRGFRDRHAGRHRHPARARKSARRARLPAAGFRCLSPKSPRSTCSTTSRGSKGLVDARVRRETVDALLQRVNLYDVRKQKLGGFSGGMRQRFGIAQAMLGSPQARDRR